MSPAAGWTGSQQTSVLSAYPFSGSSCFRIWTGARCAGQALLRLEPENLADEAGDRVVEVGRFKPKRDSIGRQGRLCSDGFRLVGEMWDQRARERHDHA